MSTQRRFERKALTFPNAPLYLRKHYTPGPNSSAIGIEGRQTGSDKIYVDEISTVRFLE